MGILSISQFGGAEIVAVIFFLVPKLDRIGGYFLLAIFAVAAGLHVLHGQFEIGPLVVYGVSVWACIGKRTNRTWECFMTDDRFVAAFEAASFRNEDFHHPDHVRLGFLYMCRFPGIEGMRRFCEGLKKLAAVSGKPSLYHETITWAFLLLIRERLARRSEHNGRMPTWDEFATNNQDLLKGKDHVLKEYYVAGTLASAFARKTFVLPDRSLTPAKNEFGQ